MGETTRKVRRCDIVKETNCKLHDIGYGDLKRATIGYGVSLKSRSHMPEEGTITYGAGSKMIDLR